MTKTVDQILKAVTEAGHFDCVAPTDIHSLDVDGASVLHKLIIMKDIRMVRQALDLGADVNSLADMGYTPLHQAAFYGQNEIAEMLIANGANVQTKNEFGQLPADVAKACGFAWPQR
jgi:ankyrin repeat protein